MTNEEFQTLMISELKKIHQRFDTIDSKFDTIDARFNAIDTKFDTIDARFVAIETRLDAIETQQHENTDFIQALLHQTEELNAKYDGLLNITVSNESFAKLEKKIDVIAYRIIDHDTDLSLLRRAK